MEEIRYQNQDFDYTQNLKIDKEGSKKFKKISVERPWLKYYSDEVKNAKLPENTIYGHLKEKNEKGYDRLAIEYFGNKQTYKELIDNIEKCAKSFASMGVKKGDVVTICMPTTPEMVYMLYALNKLCIFPAVLSNAITSI